MKPPVFIGCPVVGLPLCFFCFYQNVPKFEEVGSRHVWFWDRTRESSRHGGYSALRAGGKEFDLEKILLGFTVSTGNLNLNPFEEMVFWKPSSDVPLIFLMFWTATS